MEEIFNEYDEPELTKEQELEMYGDMPIDAPLEPQTHGEEEAYETGDKNI